MQVGPSVRRGEFEIGQASTVGVSCHRRNVMKQHFLNQKLGKRMSRKAELQRVKLPTRKGTIPRLRELTRPEKPGPG